MRAVRIYASVPVVVDLPDKYDEVDFYDFKVDGDEPIFNDLWADATEAVRRALPCISNPEVYTIKSLDGRTILLEV